MASIDIHSNEDELRGQDLEGDEPMATSDAGKTQFPRTQYRCSSPTAGDVQLRLPSVDSMLDNMQRSTGSHMQENALAREIGNLRGRIHALEEMLDATTASVRVRSSSTGEGEESGDRRSEIREGMQRANRLSSYREADPSVRLFTSDQDIGLIPSEIHCVGRCPHGRIADGCGAGCRAHDSTVIRDSPVDPDPILPSRNVVRNQSYSELDVMTSKKYRKPASYDGKDNWEDYLVQFELLSEMNSWDDKSKALELAIALRGAAQGVLSDLEVTKRKDYSSLVAALTARFQPENMSAMYKTQLKGKLRKKDQPLPELAHEIRRLVRLGYPSANQETRQQISIDCFIDALNDTEMEWSVHSSNVQTIEDAVRIALSLETFRVGRRKRATCSIRHIQEEDEYSIDRIVEKIAERIDELQIHGTPATLRSLQEGTMSTRLCFFCGIPGHKRNKCRKRLQHKSNVGKADE
ncbi:uncharacterized protein [Argopecten irradians]|uniref:uncharacterized protein n=1 Tax=Argopecten irradians TaxID=31199 RepID=UPI00371262F4